MAQHMFQIANILYARELLSKKIADRSDRIRIGFWIIGGSWRHQEYATGQAFKNEDILALYVCI